VGLSGPLIYTDVIPIGCSKIESWGLGQIITPAVNCWSSQFFLRRRPPLCWWWRPALRMALFACPPSVVSLCAFRVSGSADVSLHLFPNVLTPEWLSHCAFDKMHSYLWGKVGGVVAKQRGLGRNASPKCSGKSLWPKASENFGFLNCMCLWRE
jgi:hypothetical protein